MSRAPSPAPEGREWWLALQRERRLASPYGRSSRTSPQELAASLVSSPELAADLGLGDCPELVLPAGGAVADGTYAHLSPAVAMSRATAISPVPPAVGNGPTTRRRSSVLQTAQQLLQRLSTQAPADGTGSARGTPRRAGVTEAGRHVAARSELFSKADRAAAAWRQMQQAQREALRAAPGGGRLVPLDDGSASASSSAVGSQPTASDASSSLLRLESTADLCKLSLADFADAEVRQHLEELLQEEHRRQHRDSGGTGPDIGAAVAAPADQLLRAFLITRTPPEIPVRGAPVPPSRTACRLVASQEMQVCGGRASAWVWLP